MAKDKNDKTSEDQGLAHIAPLELLTVCFAIEGSSPYVQLAFGEKSRKKMEETHRAGEKAKGRKRREERDFEADFAQALHLFADGGHGIPATAFKNAMVSACRLTGIPMTRAKLLFHVEADGFDVSSGDPLVRLSASKGDPKMVIHPVRNANGGTDLRVRGMWAPGWKAAVRVTYDASCLGSEEVLGLMMRAGKQVGVGEGRPDSKRSCGMGWGTFEASPAEIALPKRKAS